MVVRKVSLAACGVLAWMAVGCAMGSLEGPGGPAGRDGAAADTAAPRDAGTTRPPYGSVRDSSTTVPPYDAGGGGVTIVDSGSTTPPPPPPPPPADAGTIEPPDAGGGAVVDPAYGECGRSTYDCACMCGGEPSCIDMCIGSSMACSDCFGRAQATCCPRAAAAVEACAMAAGCSDDACVASRCRAPLLGLQFCMDGGGEDPATCGGALDACTGTTACM